ncbi:unnamed protein product [Toxocara canis]|uniref:G protein-coupled receptor n=1 Tax=Toxocara canis TaxID=6265 RepID=A0A183U210_TOXCA|nr:unnamed protein product [Toxocara canis]
MRFVRTRNAYVLTFKQLDWFIVDRAELFDAEHCVIYIAVALRTVITIFVMYISIAKLKGDPVKLYTLNLYSASILSDVSSTALLMFRVTLLYRADIASSVWYTVTEVITDFAYTLVAVLYRLLSLFYVIVSIIPYTAPIFFKLHFTNRLLLSFLAIRGNRRRDFAEAIGQSENIA